MKTNHRRSNPASFQRDTKEQTERNFKPSGGPNYSLMGYIARIRHGAAGMEHDGGHQGNAVDIKQAKVARKRTDRRVANVSAMREALAD